MVAYWYHVLHITLLFGYQGCRSHLWAMGLVQRLCCVNLLYPELV